MGMNSSGGNTKVRGNSYSRFFTPAGTVDLTNQVNPQALRACNGMIVFTAAAGGTLNYKDCSGTSVAVTIPANTLPFDMPIAATTLESSSNVSVLVYWCS